MKNKIIFSLFFYFLIAKFSLVLAQMPNYFDSIRTPPFGEQPSTTDKLPGITPTQTATSTQTTGFDVPNYNPIMDNRLLSPPKGKEIGLFGQPISNVEKLLRKQGARNYSYAFGKYSKMSFSVYLVTIFFDKSRHVGGFLVEPKPPYKTVEPEARKYFMNLFLDGADLSQFEARIGSGFLEVRYHPQN